MTHQETFNIVVAHARRQGCRAIVGGQCAYRAPGGKSCFAGCLIPDDKYQKPMEGRPATHPLVADVLRDAGHDPDFVMSLQAIHDVCPPEDWEKRLQATAKQYNLEMP
jgi:hypothetical protein